MYTHYIYTYKLHFRFEKLINASQTNPVPHIVLFRIYYIENYTYTYT